MSGATGNGRGTTMKYFVNQYVGAGNNWFKAHNTNFRQEFC